MGMPFNRTEDGEIDQRYFGAQSFRRTCFVGDRTGEAILETLVSKAQELEVPYRENVMITRLLSDGKRVYGAVGYDMDDGRFLRFEAHAVVLAAGGYFDRGVFLAVLTATLGAVILSPVRGVIGTIHSFARILPIV